MPSDWRSWWSLEELDPAQRLAFVLHDMFDVPFKEIGEIVGRSPAAARKLASRARQRVLDPDCALRADVGTEAASKLVRGARNVAEQAILFSARAPYSEPAISG